MDLYKPKFDFDDILIVPNIKTHITSRYDDIKLPNRLPLFTAPMDTVVNFQNKNDFIKNKINVVFPRTIKYSNAKHYGNAFYSFGFSDLDDFYNGKVSKDFKGFHENAFILIDVANGHMQKILDYVSEMKRLRPDITIMIGNVANPETYKWYAKHRCVDYIRIGIGNGCFSKGTRILMGNGTYKNIEDVVSGDEIINMNGCVANVKRLIPKGIKAVVNLKTSMSPQTTSVTPDHNYYVGSYVLNSIANDTYNDKYLKLIDEYKWSEISSYNKNFTPLFPNMIKFNIDDYFRHSLMEFVTDEKAINKKYKTDIISNYNLGYIFGTFLSNGNLGEGIHNIEKIDTSNSTKSTIGNVCWSFDINKNAVAEKLRQCLNDEFNVKTKLKYKKNSIKVYVYYDLLIQLFIEFNEKSKRHLPQKYFVNNKNYLSGLFDGLIDNNISDNIIIFKTTSIQLIELFNIVNFLTKNTLPISTSYHESGIKYFLSSLLKSEDRNVTNDYLMNEMINIYDVNDNVEVFDLEIDDTSHSFIADNCIVHNSGCLTTKQSGIGYPMASLIYETKQIKNEMEFDGYENLPKIIADGGMKDYSDIIKALALGADCVMVGSIFNKCLESCADDYLYGIKINRKLAKFFFKKKFPIKKHFRGMSTKQAQKAMGRTTFRTSEGVVRFRKVEYSLQGWVENFEHYLRNAMSYSNSKTLDEFIGGGIPIQITKSAYDRFNK